MSGFEDFDFEQKINGLRQDADLAGARITKKKKCIPTLLIVGMVIPFIVWLVLYALQPSFVQKKQGSKYVRDNMKIFQWTLIVSVIFWVALYLYNYCYSMKGKNPMVCAFN